MLARQTRKLQEMLQSAKSENGMLRTSTGSRNTKQSINHAFSPPLQQTTTNFEHFKARLKSHLLKDSFLTRRGPHQPMGWRTSPLRRRPVLNLVVNDKDINVRVQSNDFRTKLCGFRETLKGEVKVRGSRSFCFLDFDWFSSSGNPEHFSTTSSHNKKTTQFDHFLADNDDNMSRQHRQQKEDHFISSLGKRLNHLI